jgi:aryl-alcohol dehydrogenase-like predicted oxidoreductase
LAALQEKARPAALQCITNPLDSPGELKYFAGPSRARELIAAGKKAGAGVLGIRPVQGGALTDALDRDLPPDHGIVTDFKRSATFRTLAQELGTSAAALAHRYALSMQDVDTVVLGCKNRAEVLECIAAAELGPLEPALMTRVDIAFAA